MTPLDLDKLRGILGEAQHVLNGGQAGKARELLADAMTLLNGATTDGDITFIRPAGDGSGDVELCRGERVIERFAPWHGLAVGADMVRLCLDQVLQGWPRMGLEWGTTAPPPDPTLREG